eukprot:10735872-Heterocapsa_arctica.AAC.1
MICNSSKDITTSRLIPTPVQVTSLLPLEGALPSSSTSQEWHPLEGQEGRKRSRSPWLARKVHYQGESGEEEHKVGGYWTRGTTETFWARTDN